MWRAVIKSAIVWSDGPVCSERSRSLIESCLWPVALGRLVAGEPFCGERTICGGRTVMWWENPLCSGKGRSAGQESCSLKEGPVMWRESAGELPFCGEGACSAEARALAAC
jgi:hypothetical protein